jgi:hypothetical protein
VPLLCGVIIVALVAAVAVTTWRARTAGTAPQNAPAPASAMDAPTAAEETPVGSSSPAAPGPLVETAPAPPVVPVQAVVDATERAIGPGMTMGVAVLDASTGELVPGRSGNRPFMSASLVKLLVVVDMLDRRRTDGRAIAESDLELVRRALRSSDDGAMNVLWSRYDGLGAVGRLTARLGLSATRAPSDPSQWGDTVVSAADMVRIYQHVLHDMAVGDRDLIVDALTAATPTATDGFNQLFGLLRHGASEQLYAKQAWVPYRPAGYLLHSAGVVHDSRTGHDYAIALLSIQSYISAQAARDRLSTVAAATLDAFGA